MPARKKPVTSRQSPPPTAPAFDAAQSLLGVFWSVWFTGLSVATLSANQPRYTELATPAAQLLVKSLYVVGVALSAYSVVWYLRQIHVVDKLEAAGNAQAPGVCPSRRVDGVERG